MVEAPPTRAQAARPLRSSSSFPMDVLLLDLWRGPLHARSRTSDLLGHIDFGMVIPPARAFVYYMMCPYLCFPVAALHMYGFYRCIKTTTGPKFLKTKEERYMKHFVYGVQKRVYDGHQRKLSEEVVLDINETRHALDVVNGARNLFVDDPQNPTVAYHVVEQPILKAEALFTGETWAWAHLSDCTRYLMPVLLAYMFVPSCKRMNVDLRLLWEGRLTIRQVRHPLMNFLTSYAEFNKSLGRLNVTQPAPKGAVPWSRKLY